MGVIENLKRILKMIKVIIINIFIDKLIACGYN